MSLVSAAAQNASLAMSYGGAKGSSAPTTIEVALFVGDPANGGTELAATGGYAAPTFNNDATTWPDAPADGSITSALLMIATSTGAFSGVADYFLIRDASTGDEWDSAPLTSPITVAEAGVIVQVQLTVYYNSLGA